MNLNRLKFTNKKKTTAFNTGQVQSQAPTSYFYEIGICQRGKIKARKRRQFFSDGLILEVMIMTRKRQH